MFIVLLRHAQRDPLGPKDGGINKIGRAQAANLTQQLAPQGPLPRPSVLLVSPKRRTRETVAPLSEKLGCPVTVDDALDERHDGESESAFLGRIRNWVTGLTSNYAPTDVLFVCSHLDWLHEALHLIPSDLAERETDHGFAPCEFRVFEIVDEIWYTRP
jgi:phosphohistidine phosphatase SixA